MKTQQSQSNIILIFAAAVTALLWLAAPGWDQETQHPCLLRRDSAHARRKRRSNSKSMPPCHRTRSTGPP